MNEFLETAKNLAPFLPLAKPIIDSLFRPKLLSLDCWLKKRGIDNEVINHHLYESRFEEYLLKTIEKCSIVNTLIFPNQQIHIEDIYQPLTLIDNNLKQQEKIKIESFPLALFRKYQRVLICDSAGMGKSTLSRYICLQAIKENQGIPVFIELRKINSENTILNEFLKQINSIDNIFDKDFILRLLKLGEFIIIMDGFDEITNEEKETVTQDIRDFVVNCGENFFLLTSRPEGALSTFGDFKITNIKGLRDIEAFQLFQRYDKICNSNLSNSLINEIKGVNNQVKEFLVNPFLVSLLYKTYSFKRDIPSRKSTFYNDVYTALYQDHDLSKDSYKRDKVSKLDIQDFRLVLREFANLTAKKGEIEYDKSKATQYITECKTKLPFLIFKEVNFVEDLLTTVPIFTTEGNNIKWAHKSFQDYFAAEYITYHPKKDLIVNHLIEKDVRKYENIIDLIIELDPNLIRQYVLPNILTDLISHFKSSYQYQDIPEYELAIRRMITFDTEFWINKVVVKDSIHIKHSKDEFERVKDIILSTYGKKYNGATNFNDKFLVAFSTSNRAFFIQLLGNKGLLGKSILKQKASKNPPMNTLKENPISISDSKESCSFNSLKNFSSFNQIMTETFKFKFSQNRFSFVPDINYCITLLESIETEINNTENDFILEY
jgi:hypothetical protein